MKRILFSLYLIISVSALCFAQNALWAGNAARGNDDAYPASIRSSGKAAGMSLALPEGTLVQVKNQKNGLTADVTIVSGQGKPGIFLLLNSAASDALDIHSGEVIMVEIQEKSSVSNPFLDYSADPDSFKKNLNEEFVAKAVDDPDNTAAVDVSEEMDKMGYEAPEEETAEGPAEDMAVESTPEEPVVESADVPAAVPETEIAVEEEVVSSPETETTEPEEIIVTEPVPEIVIPEVDDERDFEEIVIADSEETFDEILDYREEKDDDITLSAEPEVAEAEPFLADEISEDEMAVTAEEPAVAEPAAEPEAAQAEAPPVVDPDRVIYFLTPAELRPPEPAEEEEPVLPVWEEGEQDVLSTQAAPEEKVEEEKADEEPVIHFIPQYVESDELNAYMKETLETGARYVQVARFSEDDTDRVYENMVDLQKNFPYLPILLLPGDDGKSLRLMAGPVSRDEVGILLYAMKAHGFEDAFLNRE